MTLLVNIRIKVLKITQVEMMFSSLKVRKIQVSFRKVP